MKVQTHLLADYIRPSVELLELTHEGILCESSRDKNAFIDDMKESDFPWNS